MNKLLFLFLFAFTSNSYALALKVECAKRNLTFKQHVRVIQYVVSTIHQGDLSYGFSVQLTGGDWYHVVLKNSKEDSTYRREFSSTARTAQILGLTVNACVNTNGNYLDGIQLSN